jgi:hypothetical protein
MISALCRRFLNPLLLLLFLVGCRSVHNVDRASPSKLSREGSIVFVRPTEYSVFGTKSLSDYVEVVYEQAERNEAGLLEVRLGLRDKGGQHLWDLQGKDFPLSVKATFYDQPVAGEGVRSAPVYETNWQRLSLLRGATTDYKVVCPLNAGAYYQVTLSELVK